MTTQKIFLTDTSLTSWSGVATDGSDITVECIGGGAGAGKGTGSVATWCAGGGGEYAKKILSYVSGTPVPVHVGKGGLGVPITTEEQDVGLDGEATTFNTTAVVANGGQAIGPGGTGGSGDLLYNGGAGGTTTTTHLAGGAGGGGAAGPLGPGANGGISYNGDYSGGSGGGGNGGGTAGADGSSGGGLGYGGYNAETTGRGMPNDSGSDTLLINGTLGGGGGGGAGYASDGGNGGPGTEWDNSHGSGGGGAGTIYIPTLDDPHGNQIAGNGGLYGGGGGQCAWNVSGRGQGGNGSQGIIVITYNLPVPPSITTQPINQTVIAPTTATFMVVAAGTGTLSYQWYKNSSLIPSANLSSYTTPPTSSGDSGAVFYCVVNSTYGTATSTNATLTVLPPLTAVDFTLSPQEGFSPLTIIFTASCTGTPTYLKWIFGDGTSVDTPLQSIISHTYDTPGIYSPTLIGSDGTNTFTETKDNYIIVNQSYIESENSIVQSYCSLPYKNWEFYVDPQMHLVFVLGQYSYRSNLPVINVGEWTLAEFHAGQNNMYVSTVATGRQLIPSYQVFTGYEIYSENELIIAKNTSMKIDELRVVAVEEDLTDYFNSLIGRVYYLRETPLSVIQPEIKLSGMFSCIGWVRSLVVPDGDVLIPLTISDPYGNVIGVDSAIRIEILKDGSDYRLQYLGSQSQSINKTLKINVNDGNWHFLGYECDDNGNMTFYVDAMIVPAQDGLDSYGLPYSVAKSTTPRVGGGDVWLPYLYESGQVIYQYNWRFGKNFNLGQSWIQQLMIKDQQALQTAFSSNAISVDPAIQAIYSEMLASKVLSTLDTALDPSNPESIMGLTGTVGVAYASPGLSTSSMAYVSSFQNGGFTHSNGPDIIFS
jgi:PKD repeat protein